ncbi:MAG: hypothetical protein PHP74_01675 [Candidatus Gracilibacteria bacterium]|nr:hypothetical protein [Candidatus Gracilibacteria bacterium]
MQKFTVFTVVLSIVVIVVVADMVVNNYLPGLRTKDVVSDLTSGEFNLPDSLDISKAGGANVLGAGRLGFDLESQVVDPEVIPKIIPEEIPISRDFESEDIFKTPSTSDDISSPTASVDFEDADFVIASKNIYLRDEQLKSAGFISAYLEEESHDGSLYKTIYTDDLYDVSVKKFIIKSDETMFAKVYILSTGPSSSLSEVYKVLKIRGAEGLELEINETNQYGDGSFFINDSRRPNTAFLTFKLGNLIYGFSYPKEYHSQIKNLVKLLEWEK